MGKSYPCCAKAHPAVDAVLAIVAAHDVRIEEVVEVRCAVNRLATDVLKYKHPQSPMEARFSLEYCVAVALMDRACGPPRFKAQRLADPRLAALMDRVSVNVDNKLPAHRLTSARVVVRLANGREFEKTTESAQGTWGNPMTAEARHQKFQECTREILTDDHRTILLHALEDLPRMPSLTRLACLLTGDLNVQARP